MTTMLFGVIYVDKWRGCIGLVLGVSIPLEIEDSIPPII